MRRFPVVALLAAAAFAGGGPETTLLVVNGDSPVSLRVANEWAALRDLPPSRILRLHDVPGLRIVTMEQFRSRMLGPVMAFLRERQLEASTDLIVWSAGFPYGVDLRGIVPEGAGGQGFTPVASVTGLTFFARRVEQELYADLVQLVANRYYRREPGAPQAGGGRRATPEEQRLFVEANGALQRKDYATAAGLLSKFLETFQENVPSWYNYACCLARLGKPDEAVKALREAQQRGWRDADQTERDEDLAPLLAREDFREVVQAMRAGGEGMPQSRAFSASVSWGPDGEPEVSGESLDRYFLSVMLAYTGERGNSLPEALAYLRSAASSDGANPGGTFYFCRNDDIRSKTREGAFAPVIAALRALGRKAEMLSAGEAGQTGILPVGKEDVIGACVGRADFAWSSTRSRILPGAICEHLTSFGADFAQPGQTKISEFLRHGAAGSSGTVTEPYAIQMKFPHPAIHVHYARGFSLAEAFYQSVWGPYQLLVVGDPLARPFAKFATVKVDPGAQPWKGTAKPSAGGPEGARIEFWLDGAPVPPEIDTGALDDGAHELRAVAVEPGEVATRSFAAAIVTVANSGRALELQPLKGTPVYGAPFELRGRSQGAVEAEVWRGHELIAKAAVKGGQFAVSVPTEPLGTGPSRLFVRARFDAPPHVRSAPFAVSVADAPPRKPGKPAAAYLPGLHGRRASGEAVVVAEPSQATGAAALLGELEIPKTGCYELVLPAANYEKVLVGGQPVAMRAERQGLLFVPISAEAGYLPIQFEGKLGGERPLLLGDQVAAPASFRRASSPAVPEAPQAEGAFQELVDGQTIGSGILLPAEGVELFWKKGAAEVGAVVLRAAPPAKDAKPWPGSFVVEYQDSGGKWKPVEKPALLVCPSGSAAPLYVEIDLKPVKTKRLRLKPQGEGAALLTELQILSKPK